MAINRDKVLEAAQKYVDKKKYDKAVAELRKLIEADPNDARTLLKIGDLQAKQALYADAINTYETVGKLYSHQGFALKAIAVYKQIREIIAKHVPQLEERYGHITPKLAELYQQLGLTSDALAALDEVATRLQRQQKDHEAIEVFRRIVELDPTNPLPHLRLAEALSRVKDVEGAVFEFKTAASQLAGIGRRDDALKVLERLLHHKQDPEQARFCAELYLSRGQPQDGMQALAKLQICFQANPRDFDTLSLLARAFNAIGQGPKAIEVQKEMARVARDTGKTDLFREIVERLLRVAPHDDGVRKLASQTGSVQAVPPAPSPYTNAAMHQQQQHQQQVQVQHQQHQQAYGQQHAPPASPYASGSSLQRPPTQPLQRPATGAIAPTFPTPHQALPQPIEDDVEEISYSQYEELDDDAVIEEADVYPDEEPEQAAAVANYGAHGHAYAESSDYGFANAQQNFQESAGPNAHGHEDAHEGGGILEGQPAEDYGVDSGADGEHIQKVLADANAFRRVRLYNKALDTLRLGLELEPRSMDLHEIFRDVLIESGQTDEAVHEMLAIASLYVDALDGDSAARALQDVLAFDPQNTRAIEMLQELGYEIVDENEESANADAGYEQNVAAEQLPSYDLEEMRAADVSPEYADDRQVYVAHRGGPAPAEIAYGEGGESLPSFPLDEPDAELPYPDAYPEASAGLHAGQAREAETRRPGPGSQPAIALHIPSAGAPPSVRGSSRELEDALDEAEFFCSRGLYDDARVILNEQLGRHPNNPLLRERLAEIAAQEAQRGSGAREKPRDLPSDRAFDIAASLDALESLGGGFAQPAEGFAAPDQQVDVEEVFLKFKEGVAKQISVDDSDSHYNLGIAYKEMLLLDDAIREFDVAALDPKRECVCRSMIGMIHIERGNLNEAIEAFLQGLNAQIKDPSQETVLCYEIGAAYEAKKMNKEALSYYQKAMRRDPNYRDVQERVRRLAKAEAKPAPRQAAVGADDEFDRAFDDLLSKA